MTTIFFFSPRMELKSSGVQNFFSRLHQHEDHGDPCPFSQSRLVTGTTSGDVGRGLGQLWSASTDDSMSAIVH